MNNATRQAGSMKSFIGLILCLVVCFLSSPRPAIFAPDKSQVPSKVIAKDLAFSSAELTGLVTLLGNHDLRAECQFAAGTFAEAAQMKERIQGELAAKSPFVTLFFTLATSAAQPQAAAIPLTCKLLQSSDANPDVGGMI